MRFELGDRARGFLKRFSPETLYFVIELLLAALLAWQAARLVWTVVTPVDPVGNWAAGPAGQGASAAATLGAFDPFFRLSVASDGPATVVTPLQLTLFGTRLDSASGRGAAIIAGPDNEQKSYAVGEEVMPGVVLKEVRYDHVVFVRGGREESLFLDQSAAGGVASGGPPPGASAAPESVASAGPSGANASTVTLTRLRQEIGFIPRVDGGRVTGLAVRPQGSSGLFAQLGFKEGDIVTQIGGRPITSAADFDALKAQYAEGGNIALTIERGAEVLPMVVAVAKP